MPKGADKYSALMSRASSEGAHKLIRDLTVRVLSWEAEAGARTYARGASAKQKLSEAVERFTGDLLAAKSDRKASGEIYRSLSTKAFSGDVISHPNFMAVRDALVGLKLVKVRPHKRRFDNSPEWGGTLTLEGKTTRFAASPALVKLAATHGVILNEVDEHFGQELPRSPLVLNTASVRAGRNKERGRRMDYTTTKKTRELEAQVKRLNEFLRGFKMSGGVFPGFTRVFNEGDSKHYAWDKGGRLYAIGALSGRSYQLMDATDRARITIDGEPTVEIDVRACNLTLYHAALAEKFDATSDPYARSGLDRDIAKKWTVATFGNNGPIARWSPDTVKSYAKNHRKPLSKVCRATEARRRMLSAFPALARFGKPNSPTWADLMFMESNAVIGAMEALMVVYRVPSFPVHDSLIVPARHVVAACEALQHSFKAKVGVYPWLSTDHPNHEVRRQVEVSRTRAQSVPVHSRVR